ncbi:LysM peptidoglycan-binding domain-containing protein [Bacillus sp. B190/17]|uniref:LysM peptidoglycan-binding domain-containing protein n=1 Tax=Bacillus lumedeiriae TaxID=3058829 RepID=A0ABW8I887_9BACI
MMKVIGETRQERIVRSKKIKEHQRNSKLIGATLAMSLTAASVFVQPKEAGACDCAESYTVKAGDTLYSLAKKYQVSVEQLQGKNGLTTSSLKVGQQIIVPYRDNNGQLLHLTGKTEEVEESRVESSSSSQLQEAENAYTNSNIAETEKVSGQTRELKDKQIVNQPAVKTEQAVEASTHVNIKQGQVKKVLGSSDLYEEGKKERRTAVKMEQEVKLVINAPSGIHIVQSGDNLWSLSKKFGVTVDKIKKDNQLKSDALKIGQKLIITKQAGTSAKPAPDKKTDNPPAKGSSVVTYIVKSGDTLWNTGKKYGVPFEKIMKDNHLKSDRLTIGQKLLIYTEKPAENKKEPGEIPGQKINNEPKTASSIIYIVKTGDSLWNISKKYNVSIEKLLKDNELTSTFLSIGQKLVINRDSSDRQMGNKQAPAKIAAATYKVAAGDTIYSLAERFNTSVEQLMKINQMKQPIVLIGNELKVPAELIVQHSGKVIGAVDSTSIEVIIQGKAIAMEVSYGTSQHYQKWQNKSVTLTYVKGTSSKRPALIRVEAL